MYISHQKRTDKNTLWERFVHGDKSAFGELYSFYHKSLTAFCVGKLKSLELAENAASETLIKLLQHRNPKEIENFEHWLFTVAKNECLHHVVKTERRKKLLTENYQTELDHLPEIEVAFSIENIDKLISDNLDPTDYKIWQLYQQGYDNEEIADILELNEKTVANRKSAARSKLKTLLQRYNKDVSSNDEKNV